MKDHLGNGRVFFSDMDKNGIVEVAQNGNANELLQQEHYYPFGMGIKGEWKFVQPQVGGTNFEQFNGIELNDDFGLNWNMAMFRTYDPSIGRWGQIDPLAELFLSVSPYNGIGNNPIAFSDPLGLAPEGLEGREDGRVPKEETPPDYFVFDEQGFFLRREINDEPDQIVIENSKTKNRHHIDFNDPVHDVKLLEGAIEYHNKDIPLIHRINDSEIEAMMKESGATKTNGPWRLIYSWLHSNGGSLDFSVYHIQIFVAKKLGTPNRWSHTDFLNWDGSINEKRSPFFLFGTEQTTAYNWFDAGNWLWGNAQGRMGAGLGNPAYLALLFNTGDSPADLRAINSGWMYQAGFRNMKNYIKK